MAVQHAVQCVSKCSGVGSADAMSVETELEGGYIVAGQREIVGGKEDATDL